MNGPCTAETDAHAAADNANIDQIVESTILKCGQLATLPQVALQIIRIVDAPDTTPNDLNKVLVNDPTFGMRILKLVNSAYYGMPGEIRSIERAVLLLGFKSVKNIAIAASLTRLFGGGSLSRSFSPSGLWTHSVAVAAAAQMLAAESGLVPADEAFLAGLIHDIGIMIEMQSSRTMFIQLLQQLDADDNLTFRDAEKIVFGASHEDFGVGLCRMWNLHESLQHVTGYHHRPWDLPETQHLLPTLVHIADVLVADIPLGFGGTVETNTIDPELLRLVNLSESQLESLRERLPLAITEAQAIFEGGDPA